MKKKIINIAYVHGNSNIVAGQERILLNIIKGNKDGNIRSVVILPSSGLFSKLLQDNNINVCFIPLYGFTKKNPPLFIFTILRLSVFILKNKIDIIHVSGLYPMQYCSISARITRCICISHAHSTIYKKKEIEKMRVLESELVIAVSKGVKNNLMLMGIPENKIKVIYNGLDIMDYPTNESNILGFRNEFSYGKDLKLVGQIGQILDNKGIEDFIRMAKIITQQQPSVRFILVGDDKYSPGYLKKMKSLAYELGLEKVLFFAGYKESIADVIASFDMIVLSSYVEGLPTVILEAMLLDKPVITTNIPGTNEIVLNDNNGILVEKGDYKCLAEGVVRMLTDEKYKNRLLSNAKKTVNERFSLQKQVGEINFMYKELMRKKHGK